MTMLVVVLAHVVLATAALVAMAAPYFIFRDKSVLWLFWFVVCHQVMDSNLINRIIMDFWGLGK